MAKGNMSVTLQEMKNGRSAVIKALPEGECGRRLAALGLRPGKSIKKISGMPFGGPVTLELDGRQIAIGFGASKKIFVLYEVQAS